MNNRAPEQSSRGRTPSGNSADQPWTVPVPGDAFADKYVVDGVCGRGGLAVVLSAVHPGLGQRVAIKMLLPEWASDFDVVERFLREGRAATRIKSQHVVRVFDVGTLATGAPYLVLEYLEGHNLDDVVSMWGPLPIETAIDWVLQACEAISEAHALGIVHRDLKPGNLFLTHLPDGSDCIKVIDFGLSKLAESFMPAGSAKLTRPNDVMGSPHYMAPEQLRAMQHADERTDLWALGAVLYELIAGKTPFNGESMAELCAAVLTRAPERLSTLRPEVAPALEETVHRCLSKDPAARFASAAELARALAPHGTPLSRTSCTRIERVLEGPSRPSPTPVPGPGPKSGESSRSADVDEWSSGTLASIPGTHTSAKVVLGSFLMLAGLGIGVFMWMYEAVHANDPDRTGGIAAQPPPILVAPRAPLDVPPAPPPPPPSPPASPNQEATTAPEPGGSAPKHPTYAEEHRAAPQTPPPGSPPRPRAVPIARPAPASEAMATLPPPPTPAPTQQQRPGSSPRGFTGGAAHAPESHGEGVRDPFVDAPAVEDPFLNHK
jgi:serine/threonine-protein kinase